MSTRSRPSISLRLARVQAHGEIGNVTERQLHRIVGQHFDRLDLALEDRSASATGEATDETTTNHEREGCALKHARV